MNDEIKQFLRSVIENGEIVRLQSLVEQRLFIAETIAQAKLQLARIETTETMLRDPDAFWDTSAEPELPDKPEDAR